MKYQFAKPGPQGSIAGSIKIDLLTGPQKLFKGYNLKVDKRRVHPNPSIGIHAHPLDEVPTLEEKLLAIPFTGKLSTGSAWGTEVFLPHPYSFLLMKLFAFKDRAHDQQKEFGRHHALDLYATIGLTTEREWSECLEFTKTLKADSVIIQAGEIIAEYFADMEKLGLLRLREHEYYRPDFQLDDFIAALREVFPKS